MEDKQSKYNKEEHEHRNKAYYKKQNKKMLYAILLTTIVIVGFSYALLRITGTVMVREDKVKKMERVYNKYKKLDEIESTLDKEFLYKEKNPSHEAKMEEIYKFILDSAGDKYTRYLTKEDRNNLEESINNSFAGIGIVVKNQDGKGIIQDILPDTPASNSKFKVGDEIIKINGKKVKKFSHIINDLRGKVGTKVEVTVLRNKKEISEKLIRSDIKGKTVIARDLSKKNGYLRIESFGDNTAKETKKALSDFEKAGKKGVVIDLRNNPGGLFEESIEIADYLLPQCLITSTKDNKNKGKTYNSDEDRTKLKYVILVNKNSASSSEVLTAAIKDNHGGKVVGEKTYGKGVIQNTYLLKDGTGFTVTYREYYSPLGKKIHNNGIKPDITVVAGPKDKEDKQLKEAIKVLEKEEK